MTERWTFEGKTYDYNPNNHMCYLLSKGCDQCPHSGEMPECGSWILLDPRIPALEAENKRLREALATISETEQGERYMECYAETKMGIKDYLKISGALCTCGKAARVALEGKEPS